MLKAENLSKRYGRRTVLNRVSVSIAPGEFVAIMGSSGSGKTTLLNLLSGLDKPTSGQVNAPGRKQRAFVFQDYNLLESLNAQRNATLTARFSGRRPTRGRVAEVFDSLGLAGLESRLPAQLSGGQQQRVAVARALLAQAPYIFADEPTGALDDATASTVLSHLRAVARDGASVIMVTHSHLAAEAADRVISLEEAAHVGVA
ncbi:MULTISPECIES: ABC transporter ATP-binding protein [Corynebacterium]|uniref:ABC transporter ATP-binding protein n=1 Tax=Corynebacterium aurimucosum TaxID=169292 RepID=A0A558GK01_9CORY|nr:MULTISPECIES: ABC transporter ATP-binding protein [Corynebacterium]MBU5654023.1 ABC transporter ATP-binding protein [Corynebacterium aurimucosum]OFP20766.1 ABC transporter [Corynebacterium sp. HMSC066C02]OFQ33491.1 ABC transporter [Corynebacterium sp. HMSC072D12]OFT65514.1 ABC transporter [Corynebacterium sp. HMSC05D03]TVU57217.1 ABC transporter ATP-binding protein [Corynebacterium aurimucosum]